MVNKLIDIEVEADIFVQDLKMMTFYTDQLFTGKYRRFDTIRHRRYDITYIGR